MDGGSCCTEGEQPDACSRVGGSIADRRAARCGFNHVPRVNTSRFRCVSPLASPFTSRSLLLTIPPGLSPTALLDSPAMLHNYQALPSPTSGTIQLAPLGPEILVRNLSTVDTDKDNYDVDSFISKHQFDPFPISFKQSSVNQVSSSTLDEYQRLVDNDHKRQALVQIQMGFDDQFDFLKQDMKGYDGEVRTDIEDFVDPIVEGKGVHEQTCHLIDQTHHLDKLLKGEDMPSHQLLEGEQRGEFPTSGLGRPSEDGYNWRKYGQKHVKGSEYPRSYYKCTHPSCQVKKKVERSLDGHITEIIYKGSHNHPKPQPTRRTALGSPYSSNETSDPAMGLGVYANTEVGSTWSSQQGPKENSSVDWRVDSLERTSSGSVVTELSDLFSTTQGNQSNLLTDNPELSSTLTCQYGDEDPMQGSSPFEDAGEFETMSKRRKKESCLIESNPAPRAVREPRVVIKTVSELDILDDGYRWRKYGQKVVKGNPNPRSYYKCTCPGCSVRKHVERASHDLKSVITTYEGKHNHKLPMARNNNQISSGGSSHISSGCSSHISSGGSSYISSCGRSQSQSSSVASSMVLPKPIGIFKTEAQSQDFVPLFDTKNELGVSNTVKPDYFGCFAGDSKFGAFQHYEPHFQPTPFCSLGLNNSNSAAQQANSIANIIQEMPISFPMVLQRHNFGLEGYDFNYEIPICPESQQSRENGMRFLRLPKQEQYHEVHDSHANSPQDAESGVYGPTMGSPLQ